MSHAIARYAYIEVEFYPSSREKANIGQAIVKVYAAILKYAAAVLESRTGTGQIQNSFTEIANQSLPTLKKSIKEEEQRLQQWVQSDRLLQIDEKAATILESSENLWQEFIKYFSLPIAEGASYDSYDNQHQAMCLQNTREELCSEIVDWSGSSDDRHIFWLNGMAGTGKSTIARTIAQTLKDNGRLGASFFFKRGEQDRGGARRFISTIARQLMTRKQQLASSVTEAIRRDPDIATKSLSQQFGELLLRPLQELDLAQPTTLVVVIDALDECESDGDIRLIIRLLSQFQKVGSLQLRVFLTSRPDLPTRLGFRDIGDDRYQHLILHDIPHQLIERDIRLFLEHQLLEIQKDRDLPSGWPGSNNIQALVSMAIPLFIFAATMCRILEDDQWPPEDNLREILTRQTGGSQLDGTYQPVLSRLLANQSGAKKEFLIRDYQKVIGAIIMLESPLPASSLSRLIDIPWDRTIAKLNSLHSVLYIPDNATLPVRVFHLSFRDYLIDPETRGKTSLWVNEKETHQILATRCLDLMCRQLRKNICGLPGYETDAKKVDPQSINEHLPPELRYSCRYWVHHLERSSHPATLVDKVSSFLREHFLHWMESMNLLGLGSEIIGIVNILQPIVQVTLRTCRFPQLEEC